VACTEVDGRPVAVTGGYDGTVRVWDLATGQPVGDPPARRAYGALIVAVACIEVDGRPVAVTGGSTVRVWDLTTDRSTGEELTGHTDHVEAVACTEVDGRPVAVTGSYDGTVRVWDLRARVPVDTWPVWDAVTAVTTGPDGRHAIIAAGWDVATFTLTGKGRP
jgi:WD40 repeat protein